MSGMADWVTGCAVTRREAVLTLALGSSAVLAACAAPAASPTSAPAKPATAASPAPTPAPTAAQPAVTAVAKPPPAPSPAPKPTQAPAKPQVAKVTIGQPAVGLAFAPIYVARARKFFEDEAIDADVQVMQNLPVTLASLVSGESHFIMSSANEQFGAHEKGLGFIVVTGVLTAVTLEFVVRKEFLQQKRTTPQQPLKDKINALKGAKIGVSSLTGPTFQYAKFALKMAGLDAETDAELLAIQSGPPSVAALREGQVDAFVLSPPDPEVAESEGFATVLIKLAEEVPVLRNVMYNGVFAKRSWVEQNPGVTERVCRAIGRANNLIANDLPAAKEALRGGLSQIKPEVLDLSIERMKTAFAPDGKMTEEMWKNLGNVFAGAGQAIPPLAEGTLWTNKYLVNVPKR